MSGPVRPTLRFRMSASQSLPVAIKDAAELGSNPGDGTPEVPLAVGLPLAAAGLVGGTVLFRRRKAARAAA